jgi:hypothetical protein
MKAGGYQPSDANARPYAVLFFVNPIVIGSKLLHQCMTRVWLDGLGILAPGCAAHAHGRYS